MLKLSSFSTSLLRIVNNRSNLSKYMFPLASALHALFHRLLNLFEGCIFYLIKQSIWRSRCRSPVLCYQISLVSSDLHLLIMCQKYVIMLKYVYIIHSIKKVSGIDDLFIAPNPFFCFLLLDWHNCFPFYRGV